MIPALPSRGLPRALLALALAVTLAACTADIVDDDEASPGAGTATAGAGGTDGASGGGTGGGTDAPPADAGSFALRLPAPGEALLEGGDGVTLRIAIERADDHDLPVTLAASEEGADEDGLVWQFAETVLDAGRNETSLSVALPIGPRPRLPGARALRIVATDPSGTRLDGQLELNIEPTARPDLYILAGQSNMVGASRADAREAGPGEPDAPHPRIYQLDVTFNDPTRFPTRASFTDVSRIAATDRRIITALDPLHDIRDRGNDTKGGTSIGLGLSFAKAALAGTTADIVLVPTAWSDSGFCRRESLQFPDEMGWHAREPDSPAFSGTLLHDRAIARTDLTIAETGGVLRGILWHQGEADSDDAECANAYAGHLRDMVASLRTNIAPDARGPDARGPDADIPFVVGTMSKGDDDRGAAFAPFGEIKSIVDGVHRNVASIVPLSDFVNADDLVPPAYPCGFGDCIHFGAEALRELGTRYHERLDALLEDD